MISQKMNEVAFSASATCLAQNKLDVHLLEALAMVITACVTVVARNDRPYVENEPVLMCCEIWQHLRGLTNAGVHTTPRGFSRAMVGGPRNDV